MKLMIVPQKQTRRKRDIDIGEVEKKLYLAFDGNGKAMAGDTETIINIYYGGFTKTYPKEVALQVLNKGFITAVGTDVYITDISKIDVGTNNSSFIMKKVEDTGYLSFTSVSEKNKAICFDNVNKKIVIGMMADTTSSCLFANAYYGKKNILKSLLNIQVLSYFGLCL